MEKKRESPDFTITKCNFSEKENIMQKDMNIKNDMLINNKNPNFQIINYKNGDKYEGSIINNKKEGKGKIQYKNGEIYWKF